MEMIERLRRRAERGLRAGPEIRRSLASDIDPANGTGVLVVALSGAGSVAVEIPAARNDPLALLDWFAAKNP